MFDGRLFVAGCVYCWLLTLFVWGFVDFGLVGAWHLRLFGFVNLLALLVWYCDFYSLYFPIRLLVVIVGSLIVCWFVVWVFEPTFALV